MSVRRVLPYGPEALLVECDAGEVNGLATTLRRVDGVLDVVPGACTVLVVHARRAADLVRSAACDVAPAIEQVSEGRVVVVPVVYDGADLAEVAEQCGLTPEQVVAQHTAGVYTVAFCGFSPGFAYVSGLSPALAAVPRRPTPRPRVPAGSVAVAGGYTAVYPRASPGGWNLLGHTDLVLWDASAPEPASLQPGTAVRFEAVT